MLNGSACGALNGSNDPPRTSATSSDAASIPQQRKTARANTIGWSQKNCAGPVAENAEAGWFGGRQPRTFIGVTIDEQRDAASVC